jgi:acetyl-CoA acetyltransferase
MRPVYVLGVGMTKFGKYIEKSLKNISFEATWNAIHDSGIRANEIEMAFFANAYAGLITGQESIRGQTVLREIGLMGIPIFNIENACASGSSAFSLAHLAVASGQVEVALALGAEKLFCGDLNKSLHALASSSDLEIEGRMGILFAGIYSMRVRNHMAEYGLTREQLAKVAVKNHDHGALNPYAQYRDRVSVDEVLGSRMIADPITLLMTCPMGDGAAAVIVGSEKAFSRLKQPPVRVASTVLQTARISKIGDKSIVERTAKEAYNKAGISPRDVNVAEVHDAVAPIELLLYEQLGFCRPGESGHLIDDGITWIGGSLPVNPSGGLSSKGHPAGATGLAQITELVWHLRGEAGERQVKPIPKVALAENGGGNVAGETAAVAVHILVRE